MSLSPAGQYLYFLFVVAIYGAPVALLVLIVAWRRGQLRRALAGVAIAAPLLALGVQFAFQLSLGAESAAYAERTARIESLLGGAGRDDVIRGELLAPLTQRGAEYRRYRFPASLDPGATLEVLIPPDGSGRIAEVRVVDASMRSTVGSARLILWPTTQSANPAVAPADWFARHHPGLDPDAFGPHTLILQLRARDSVLVHPGIPPRDTWRWTRVSVEGL